MRSASGKEAVWSCDASAPRGAPARLAAALLLSLSCATAQGAPSTFGPVIGSAILCRSHLDNAYFYDYLSTAFGPSYKHEGGAYWFKADGNLWGTPVTDIMVSDDSSDIVFVGAVTDSAPEDLDKAIRAAMGVRHDPAAGLGVGVRQSRPGSRIIHFKAKSKIYCAKYKPLPILR